jgi:hypothetical protein
LRGHCAALAYTSLANALLLLLVLPLLLLLLLLLPLLLLPLPLLLLLLLLGNRACHLSVGEQLLAFTTDSFMGSPPQIHLVDLDLQVKITTK